MLLPAHHQPQRRRSARPSPLSLDPPAAADPPDAEPARPPLGTRTHAVSPRRDPTTFVGLLRQYHPYICIVLILFVVGGGEIEQKTGTPLIKGAAMAREFIQAS